MCPPRNPQRAQQKNTRSSCTNSLTTALTTVSHRDAMALDSTQRNATTRNGRSTKRTDIQRRCNDPHRHSTSRINTQRTALKLNEPHRHSTNRNDTQRAVVVDELGLCPRTKQLFQG